MVEPCRSCEKCEKRGGVLSPVLSSDFASRGNASADQDAHLPEGRGDREAVPEVEHDRGHERGVHVGVEIGGVLIDRCPHPLVHIDSSAETAAVAPAIVRQCDGPYLFTRCAETR